MEFTLYLEPQFVELKKTQARFFRNIFVESTKELHFNTAVLEDIFFLLCFLLHTHYQVTKERHITLKHQAVGWGGAGARGAETKIKILLSNCTYHIFKRTTAEEGKSNTNYLVYGLNTCGKIVIIT